MLNTKRLALVGASFHLLVLLSGAFPAWMPIPSEKLLLFRELYQDLTGAGGSFGFFSPGLGNQLLIRFETKPPGTGPLALEQFGNGELALRLGNMARTFSVAYEREDWKRSLAASLAAQAFRVRPESTEVTLIASAYQFPSLLDWRAGKRPVTEEAYRATFRRKVAP